MTPEHAPRATKPSHRNKALLAALVVAVVAGVYLLSRPPSPPDKREALALPIALAQAQPTPPEAAAPAAHTDAPAPAMVSVPAGGDAAYKREVACVKAARVINLLAGPERVCKEAERFKSDPASHDFFASCARRQIKYAQQKLAAEKTLRGCPTAAPADIEFAFFQATVAAAKAGNIDARMCYLNSRFNLEREWTEEERAQYKADAPRYVEEAFASGDWRIVETYRLASERMVNRSTLLHLVAPYDASYQYAMNSLMRLGTTDPQFAKGLDNVAASPYSPLDEQAKADANRWAQDMYHRYFRHSPKLTQAPIVCGEYPLLL